MARTHRENVLRRLGLPVSASPSLPELARYSGTKLATLKEIEKRGRGAHANNPASVRLKKDFSKNPNLGAYPISARLPAAQWARARVYSFLDKGKTYYTADSDLRA
jgi:hypothetical protein